MQMAESAVVFFKGSFEPSPVIEGLTENATVSDVITVLEREVTGMCDKCGLHAYLPTCGEVWLMGTLALL